MSVNQTLIPLSNATMEVLKQDALPIRTYIWVSTPNGITEVYRTRQPQESHTSGYSTIQMDHAVCEIGDYLVQNSYNAEKTVREAFVTLFSHYRGDKWQLGSFNAPETVILDCDYDNILETMLAVLEQAPQYYMTFDFSTSPWTLSLAQKSATVTAEGRMSRNIANDSIRYDDKDQCTRVYVKGLPKPEGRESDPNAIGYMDADAATIAEYGIIEKETGSGNLTTEQATRIAQAYLDAHKLPKRSVELDGDDLTEITGETLDSFICGKKFRLVVPEDNLVIEDYITKVTFQDAINSPAVNVVIGDELDATINFLQAQASQSKAGGRSAKKQDKENAIIHSEIYATGSMLYSYVEQTATYIVSVVENAESQMGSSILQTAQQIRSEVHAANSTLYSYVDQTATSIRAVVADVNADLHSEILQTQSMIRSAVWTANSTVFSYVDQTASYILDHVGERSGSKVIPSETMPEDTPDNPLNVGDLWIEGTMLNTWDDMEGEPWIDYDPTHPEYDWSQLKGQKVYVWKNGKWQLALDETTVAEDTAILRTKEAISLIAYNQKVIDGEWRSNVARLDVKADKITATVEERVQQIGSNITQTARQIRAEVHAAGSQLYSYIEQTATYITSVVADVENGLQSQILQTSSQIMLSVQNSVSSLRSSINVESDRISLVVEGTGANAKIKPASIVNSINNGASTIIISADHINLDGYVKATDLTTDWLSAKIAGITSLGVQNMAASGSISIKENNVYYGIKRSINALQISQSGNTYTLQYKKWDDTNWQSAGSFSRAVSSWVWGGGNGRVNVTALPQNQTKSVNLSIDGTTNITSNGTYIFTVDYENSDGDDVSTGATKAVTVNVSGGSHNISITPDNVGHSDEPAGTRLWSSTTLQRNKWYKFTVNCGTAQKVYKILINN